MAPQNLRFFKESLRICSYHGLWSKMPLGSLQEPAKSLPGASQEPFKGSQEAPKGLEEAPCSLLRAVSELQKTETQASNDWYQLLVPSIACLHAFRILKCQIWNGTLHGAPGRQMYC